MTGLAAVEKLTVEEEFFEKEFQEKITRPGPIKFICILANDSYKGLDQIVKTELMVIDKDETRVEYTYLPEDAELMKEEKPEEEVVETADSDTEAPAIELDQDELFRKL